MIKYCKGDVTEADFDVLVHGCNAQGKMASGVAKCIADKWPIVKEHYLECYETFKNNGYHKSFLGSNFYVVIDEETGRSVNNAITQQFYGYDGEKYVSYDAIDKVMASISRVVGKDEKIVMPKIGSEKGGGDWNVIEKIIESHLSEHDVTIYYL